MEITKQTVDYLSNLARIQLSPEDSDKLSKQLQEILNFIETLNKADTGKVGPTSHILPLKNIFRDDSPADSLKTAEALANAPKKEGNFFSVPKVIE